MTTARTACNCAACTALAAECGELTDLYRKRLLIRGWGGTLSTAERAYVRAHRSEAERRRAEKAGRALRRSVLPPFTPLPAGERGSA